MNLALFVMSPVSLCLLIVILISYQLDIVVDSCHLIIHVA